MLGQEFPFPAAEMPFPFPEEIVPVAGVPFPFPGETLPPPVDPRVVAAEREVFGPPPPPAATPAPAPAGRSMAGMALLVGVALLLMWRR